MPTTNLHDFVRTRVLRHPTTWLIAAVGASYGGISMLQVREAHRAAVQALQFPWLWLERTLDFSIGAAYQLVVLGCSIWFVAGLMEDMNVWLQQATVFAIYLGLIWFAQYL